MRISIIQPKKYVTGNAENNTSTPGNGKYKGKVV